MNPKLALGPWPSTIVLMMPAPLTGPVDTWRPGLPADLAVVAGGPNAVGKEGAGGGTVYLGRAGTGVETDGKGVGRT